ncbi:NAD(P)H-binding protein [Labedaea rhizosphaerae]|uniref:Uncharacterized protein YbjT (DUF2867 family) n=1 Tax=Labedaea rhizosphaerae TaxID=598644 RepID=A0A4R6SGW1_LABRH|nr:NAD(P)H-binding protein [Labedaea rhizosphaerae]TDQ00817.1 uncharacterized protein YbjT (DUF2867 family) [Labedaea rhizosphaerae]
MRVAVAGASGFIGRRLCAALAEQGHTVCALTRRPDRYAGAGEPVAADVRDPGSLVDALRGAEAAYYLVHSLDQPAFARLDAEAARNFALTAGDVRLPQIIYLGGLGDGKDLSTHVRSRHQVEHRLAATGVPVTALRAAVVVGHGGTAWEMTRQLVEHLPVMLTPPWVRTRTQPIAAADAIRYLTGVLGNQCAFDRTLEIGGTEVLEYGDMLRRLAAIQGRSLRLVPAPVFHSRLAALGLALVTDIDLRTARALIGSMANEAVVEDDSARSLVPFTPMDYDEAALAALSERAAALRT